MKNERLSNMDKFIMLHQIGVALDQLIGTIEDIRDEVDKIKAEMPVGEQPKRLGD